MDKQVERQCPVCRATYYANATRLKFGRQTTCSRRCSYEARAALLKNAEERECGSCGKKILVCPSKVQRVRHGSYFCSRACAYRCRKRVVERPYVYVAEWDRKAAAAKAAETRRRNGPRKYPEAAREKARAAAIERLKNGLGVSRFERKVAEVFRSLGFFIATGVVIRRSDGTFAHVIDIVLPHRGIAVECHGTYWHGGRWSWIAANATQAKNLRYEERKFVAIRDRGMSPRILWEHEFERDPCGACLAVAR